MIVTLPKIGRMIVDRLGDLQAFVAVVEHGGLTAAARRLGRSLQSVSRSLAAVERMAGVELVRRTTRRSAATEAGRAFHRRVAAALSEIEAARAEAASVRAEPEGVLRLTASTAFAPLYLVPAIGAFLARHPRVEVELDVADGFTDLVAQGIDLAVRIGDLPDSALKARRLAELRRVVFAAPDYLARHGRPRTPADLARHACIVRTASREGAAWPFLIAGRLRRIAVAGRFRTSGAQSANAAVAAGQGIGNAPLWQVRSLVDAGAVELLLIRYEPPLVPVHAVWPATRLLPARTQAFIDFLGQHLRDARL